MKSRAYKTALAIGFISGVLALFIAINLTVNHLRLKSADPLNSVALEELRAELRDQPENESLKTEIRNLDLLARRAYFTSLAFTNSGAWLLLATLAIMAIAFKMASNISKRPPHPDKFEEKDESLEYASQARESLVATLGIMGIVVLFVLLATKSPPDFRQTGNESAEKDTRVASEDLQAQAHLNWPAFRGPYGVGVAHYTNAPTAWNGTTGENILWKKPLPRAGFSSPVVWGDRVFVTCADKDAREVLCFDGDNGELLWRKEIGPVPGMPPDLPDVEEDTTYAASTPATDGRSVFAIFGTGNIACFDFEGNRQWVRHLVDAENIYGHASSLMVYKNLLFVQFDDDNRGRVFALDTGTGKTVWLAERELEPCWSTPIIARADTDPQLVVSGNPMLISYAPASGDKLWESECLGGEVASSPAYADGMVYTANEYAQLTALKLADPVELAWEGFDALPDVSSPLAGGDYLIVATGYGIVHCYNSETGEVLWTREFDEGFYSSPIRVGARIYLMDKTGVMHIFKAADEYEEIATCELGEPATTIPAIMDGKIYLRGVESLFCIGTE